MYLRGAQERSNKYLVPRPQSSRAASVTVKATVTYALLKKDKVFRATLLQSSCHGSASIAGSSAQVIAHVHTAVCIVLYLSSRLCSDCFLLPLAIVIYRTVFTSLRPFFHSNQLLVDAKSDLAAQDKRQRTPLECAQNGSAQEKSLQDPSARGEDSKDESLGGDRKSYAKVIEILLSRSSEHPF